jgi:dihydroorotase
MYKNMFPNGIPPQYHPEIRTVEACYKMTEFAVDLAKKTGARLHVLHISTKEELAFFSNEVPLEKKKITAEACVHHLWFDSNYYYTLGNLIKCNPAIKSPDHKGSILEAVKNNIIDVIATDHAPHTWEEKQLPYEKAPSGLPLIQHSLLMMLDFYNQGLISLEKIVEKMCHHPAILFDIEKRGFVREGYFADLVVIDPDTPTEVTKENILFKCGWSPLEGKKFKNSITHTFVNGHLAYSNGVFDESVLGQRLSFDR